MGLLDDAIREHLELKRRHGADPEEVTRQEREALGAPVRGEFAQTAAGAAGDAPASEVDEELRDDAPATGDEAAAPGDELEPPEEAALAAPRPGDEEDPWLVEELADEPPADEPPPEAPPADEPPPEAPPAAVQAPPPAEEPPAEDVLEETPEFLQETPEHERLWFEQKPPRDFDWDK